MGGRQCAWTPNYAQNATGPLEPALPLWALTFSQGPCPSDLQPAPGHRNLALGPSSGPGTCRE